MKMTYAIWMKDTAVFGRARSKELRAVDDALKTYENAEKNRTGSILKERNAIDEALTAWKQAKGDWRNNARNKLKAVERLQAELGLVIVGAGGLNSRGELMMDPEEAKARKIVAEAIKKNAAAMFKGRKLTAKNSKKLVDQGRLDLALNHFKNMAKGIKSAAPGVAQPNYQQQVQNLLANLFGETGAGHVEQALGLNFIMRFVDSVTPFVGAIASGGKAIVKWGQAALGLYHKSQIMGGRAPSCPATRMRLLKPLSRFNSAKLMPT